MDEETHAGDDEKHDQRKLIEHEAEIDVQRTDVDPTHRAGFDVGQGTCWYANPEDAPSCIHHHAERSERGKQRHGGHQPLWHPRAEDSVQQKPGKGQQRNQPDIEGSVHSFIRSIRSTARVARARKTAIMMARPTAASAAATIMTKKTKI